MSKLLPETADCDVPGSWGRASEGWPWIHDPTLSVRSFAIRHKDIVPYGAYVTVNDELRIHPDYMPALRAAIGEQQ